MESLPDAILIGLFAKARFDLNLVNVNARWQSRYLELLEFDEEDLRKLFFKTTGIAWAGDEARHLLNTTHQRLLSWMVADFVALAKVCGRKLNALFKTRAALHLFGGWCAIIERISALRILLEDPRSGSRMALALGSSDTRNLTDRYDNDASANSVAISYVFDGESASLSARVLRWGHTKSSIVELLASHLEPEEHDWEIALRSAQSFRRCNFAIFVEMALRYQPRLDAKKAIELISQTTQFGIGGDVRKVLLGALISAMPKDQSPLIAISISDVNRYVTSEDCLLLTEHPATAPTPDHWMIPLQTCCRDRSAFSIEALKRILARPDCDPTLRANDCLKLACRHGNAEAVEAILRDGRCDPQFGGLNGPNLSEQLVQYLTHSTCNPYASSPSKGDPDRVLQAFLADPRYDPTYGNPHVEDRLATIFRSKNLSDESLFALLRHPRVDPIGFLARTITNTWKPENASSVLRKTLEIASQEDETRRRAFSNFALRVVSMHRDYFQNDSILAFLISERLSANERLTCPLGPSMEDPWVEVFRQALCSERLQTAKTLWPLVPVDSKVPYDCFNEAIEKKLWKATRALAEIWDRENGLEKILRSLCRPESFESLETLLSHHDRIKKFLPDYEALVNCAQNQSYRCATILLETAELVGKSFQFKPAKTVFESFAVGFGKKRIPPNSKFVVLHVLQTLKKKEPSHERLALFDEPSTTGKTRIVKTDRKVARKSKRTK